MTSLPSLSEAPRLGLACVILQHKVNVLRDGVGELVLDTRSLKVSAATVGGKEAEFSFGEPHKVGNAQFC